MVELRKIICTYKICQLLVMHMLLTLLFYLNLTQETKRISYVSLSFIDHIQQVLQVELRKDRGLSL